MTTKIQWTHIHGPGSGATWNPVTGCSKVSPGCVNCYAERLLDGREHNEFPEIRT